MIKTGLLDKNGIELCVGHKVRGVGTYRDYLSPVHQIITQNENGMFMVGNESLEDFRNNFDVRYTCLEIVN